MTAQQYEAVPCDWCLGMGTMGDLPCEKCQGLGTVPMRKHGAPADWVARRANEFWEGNPPPAPEPEEQPTQAADLQARALAETRRNQLEMAQDLLAEMETQKRRQGGVTPQQLESLAARWGLVTNPGFSIMGLPALLGDISDAYVYMVHGNGSQDERHIAARMALVALQLAGTYEFDLLEVVYEMLETQLQNAVAAGGA